MATILPFPNHVLTSADSPAASSARASSVISGTDRSAASRAKGNHRADGMPPLPLPLARQPLTVDGSNDSASATALVPPSASMTKSGVIMPPNIVCTVQTCQEFATRKTTFSGNYAAIGSMMDPPHIVSARLKALRIELGYKSQSAFAAKLGIDKSTYNPYEKGTRPLTFETACLIRREFGISIDWLFFGDLHQSAVQTMAKIGRGSETPQPKQRKVASR